MATLDRHPSFPHVLLVTGSDVYVKKYRTPLKKFLYDQSPTTSPVSKGTHDFWVTYSAPHLGAADHAGQDLDAKPRMLRGILKVGGIPTSTALSTMEDKLYLVLHEAGHHWLVPNKMWIPGQPPVPKLPDLVNTIIGDLPWKGPPLTARQNSHWCAWVDTNHSPMDGQAWKPLTPEGGFDVWEWRTPPPLKIDPPGLPSLDFQKRFSDLELMMMGAMGPWEAHHGDQWRFRWMEPRLTAPLDYLIGLVVASRRREMMFFGFHRDHRTLAVYRSGDSKPLAKVKLDKDYKPLMHLALRVIREGNQYVFQARYDKPGLGCLLALLKLLGWYKGGIPHLFENLDDATESAPDSPNPVATLSPPSFKEFVTVAKIKDSMTPRALGMIVKNRNSCWVEGAFHNLEVKHGNKHHVMTTGKVPPYGPQTKPFKDLKDGELSLHVPRPEAVIRTDGRDLLILNPRSVVEDDEKLRHIEDPGYWSDATDDAATKVLTNAPEGDFAFGSSVRVNRSLTSPWAGGAAKGKTMWGHEASASTLQLQLPYSLVPKQVPPPADTYKFAFMILAEKRAHITDDMIEAVDRIRQYWDTLFPEATRNRRFSSSTLD